MWRSVAFTLTLAFSGAAFAQTQIDQAYNSQGPAPSFGPVEVVQSKDSPPNGSVAGAVQAILPDPALGTNTIFLGSSNGGVWVTNNGGTSWTPLTDNQASNSIASLTLDPTDTSGKTIIAGTGITSNGSWNATTGYQSAGGLQDGLLYSTNGGTTWSALGSNSALFGESVIGVDARGSTVLAATFEEQSITTTRSASGNPYGLYRSTDGGSTFTLVSGSGVGLPAGPVTSLVADPSNPNKFYAAITSLSNPNRTSVYVSTDDGAHWSAIFTNTTAISGGSNIIGSTGDQLVLKLAAGPNNSVALAVVDCCSGNTSPYQILTALYLSQNSGGTWSQLATPATNAGSNQAAVNLALAIDPNNTSIVYITGDAVANAPYTLTAFRVQGNSAITLNNAQSGNGSAVHADSRAAVFDPAGNLLVGSDGGIYERTNPESTSGVWKTLNTSTLSIREPYAVAFDSNSKLVVVAAQDTGVALQSAPASPLYNAIQPADGTLATLNDKTLVNQTAIYTSYYNYGGLSRLIVNSDGSIASPTPTPAGVPITCNNVDCATAVAGAGGDFSAQFVLNRIDPSLIALGGSSLYVTQDTLSGTNWVNAPSVNLTLSNAVGSTGTCNNTHYDCISAIAYGTRDNTNALIAGTNNNNLYISTTATPGSLSQLTAYAGGAPASLVFDTRSSSRFYVVDGISLYGTTNTGNTFSNLTANLPSGFIDPTSVEFIANNGVNALLVGGLNNYANAQSPITIADSDASGTLSNWRPFGSGLPNVIISVLNYNATADVLAVGAVGRGVWLLYDVTSYFPQATVLQFGLANNDSNPDPSVLTDGTGGPRPLIKYGTGNLIIAGPATYTGGTMVTDGTLTIGDDAALGTGPLSMAAGTALSFMSTGNFTIANNITVSGDPSFTPPLGTTQTLAGVISDGSSPGIVEMQGSGTLVLSGANTYSGGTVISSGTLQVTNNSSVGTGTVALDGGTFQSGAAGLVFGNAFVLNTTGGTIDTQANALMLAGTIANGNGTTGALTKIGSGSLILASANTYSGGTVISSGTLQATNNSSVGTGTVTLDGGTFQSGAAGLAFNNTLAINNNGGSIDTQANALTLAGTITNGNGTSGALNKIGGGTLILSGMSSYSGATNVNAGTLEVDGAIVGSSSVSVNSSGGLTGIGTVGPSTVAIASGGTLAPGTPGLPGTSMTIVGNLAFQSGALYVVYLNQTASTFANIAGSAALSGNALAVFSSGAYAHQQQYDILHSAGLNGTTFTSLATINLPTNFAASLSYSNDDVFLNLNAALGAGTSLNQNQQKVATGLNNFFNSGGTLPSSFSNIFGLNGANLANALSQLSGEAATDAEKGAFELMNQFLGLMLDPFVDGRSGTGWPGGGGQALGFAPNEGTILPPDVALAYAGVLKAPKSGDIAPQWSAWGSSFGGSSMLNGDPMIGSTDVTARDYGFAAGMDRHFSQDAVAGFALAGGGTNWGLAQGLGGGRSDAFQAGVYGTMRFGPAYVAGALAFANHWMTTNRFGYGGDQLTASFSGQSYAARVESGNRSTMTVNGVMIGVTPYAAVQVQDFHTPGYSETDLTGGGFGLSYSAMSATDTRSELGARFDDLTTFGTMPISLRASTAWAHDWVSNPALGAVFEALPGADFTVNGAAAPRNSALASAGTELHITRSWSLTAKFDGEFASGGQTYAGAGTLRYVW